MQRIFISIDQKKENRIFLKEDDVHHLKNVMRVKKGDFFVCCDSHSDYIVQVEVVLRHEIICGICDVSGSSGEPKTNITLAQSLPKREKFEWILQKGTEIGAVQFLPFVSSRTMVKVDDRKVDVKVSRWRKIVKEAAEQAHRGKIPKVETPLTWEAMLNQMSEAKNPLIFYEKEGENLQSCLSSSPLDEFFLIVGPEGGFEEREIEEAKCCGAKVVTLGPRILRTETAPLVALSSILFQRGDI